MELHANFCSEGVRVPPQNPKLEHHNLSPVRDCLFGVFAATFRTWRPSPTFHSLGASRVSLDEELDVASVSVNDTLMPLKSRVIATGETTNVTSQPCAWQDVTQQKAVPYLIWLFAGSLSRRRGFVPRAVRMEFMVDKVSP
jgi:hypothetical protein